MTDSGHASKVCNFDNQYFREWISEGTVDLYWNMIKEIRV